MNKKIYYISADIEGCTDVTNWDETDISCCDWQEAREQMTAEVAAAALAVLDSGNDVVIRDGHDSARNIIHSKLPRGARLMRGWDSGPERMVSGLDEKYAGLLCVGYHSPGGTGSNPLAHSHSHSKLVYVKINGKLASEFTSNRLFAASFGVPTIFLSGDKGMCDIAEEEVPGIVTAAVKDCRGDSTFNMHPLDACDLIYDQVSKALIREHETPVLPEKLELEVRCVYHQTARSALWIPGVELVDANTIRYTASNPTELNFVRVFVTK